MNYISDAKVYPDLEPNEICLIYAASPAEARENYTAASAAGGRPLIVTAGSLADSDTLKKLLSGINGAGVCCIRAVLINDKKQLAAFDLLKAQGFDGTVICPFELA